MYSEEPVKPFPIKRVVGASVAVILLIAFIWSTNSLWENVDADEILVVQSPLEGELTWHTTGGVKWQGWGTVTKYKKRSIYEFEAPVQFNDGGKGTIYGSVQYDLPLDQENLKELHTRFGGPEAIQKQVIEVVTNKVIYMTGPVMSSRESYAEKRNDLIRYAQDQIDRGVYQTRQVSVEQVDQFTGLKKLVTIAEIVIGASGPARQESSVVGEFGIRAFNFAIERIDYDDVVENQIKEQQKILMEVQTAVADATKAQQEAITTEQQGKAEAAKAKWDQEVKNATVNADAEQRQRTAKLDLETADLKKKATILLAEGEAEARKLVMEADGALDKKLQAYIQVCGLWADAVARYNGAWVPSIVMGGTGGTTGAATSAAGATDFIGLLTMKAAKDLALDLEVNATSSSSPLARKRAIREDE